MGMCLVTFLPYLLWIVSNFYFAVKEKLQLTQGGLPAQSCCSGVFMPVFCSGSCAEIKSCLLLNICHVKTADSPPTKLFNA